MKSEIIKKKTYPVWKDSQHEIFNIEVSGLCILIYEFKTIPIKMEQKKKSPKIYLPSSCSTF